MVQVLQTLIRHKEYNKRWKCVWRNHWELWLDLFTSSLCGPPLRVAHAQLIPQVARTVSEYYKNGACAVPPPSAPPPPTEIHTNMAPPQCVWTQKLNRKHKKTNTERVVDKMRRQPPVSVGKNATYKLLKTSNKNTKPRNITQTS